MTDHTRQRGSILVLFALLLVVIIIFLALVVDIGRLTSAKRGKGQSADLLSLAFLEAYLQQVSTTGAAFDDTIQQQAFLRGLDRAVAVGAENRLLARWNEQQVITVGRTPSEARNELVENQGNSNRWNFDGAAGGVRLARWFPRTPAGLNCGSFPGVDERFPANTCPCPVPPPGEPPGCLAYCDNRRGCKDVFNPNDPNRRVPANAVVVSLKTRETGAIRNLFASIIGRPESHVENSGAAAALPRHVAILVDLSRPTAVEKHLPWQKSPTGARPSEFAFPCNNEPDAGDPLASPPVPPSCSMFRVSPDVEPPDYEWPGFAYPQNFGGYGMAWNGLPASPCVSGGPTTKLCYRPYQTEDGAWYLVDKRAQGQLDDAASAYQEVRGDFTQPYTRILQTANFILTAFSENQSPGDLVGLIGFDRKVVDNDANPVAGPRYRPLAPPVDTNADFRRMLRLTSSSADNLEMRARAKFIPGVHGELTDLPLAVWHGSQMLSRDSFSTSSDNMIFLITSGLTNCHRMDLAPALRDPAQSGSKPKCSREYVDHLRSLQEVFEVRVEGEERGTLEAESMRLHVILIGNNVRPHTVAAKLRGSPQCMNDAELLENNFVLSLPNSSAAVGSDEYGKIGTTLEPQRNFEPAYWLSAAAAQVGGIFLPIRPPTTPGQGCQLIADYAREEGNICPLDADATDSAIRTACRDLPDQTLPWLADPVANTLRWDLKPGDNAVRNTLGATILSDGSSVSSVAMDNVGRILCDRRCRDGAPLSTATYPEITSLFTNLPMSLVDERLRLSH